MDWTSPTLRMASQWSTVNRCTLFLLSARGAKPEPASQQPQWLTWFTDGAPTPAFLARAEAVRDVLTAEGRTPTAGALAWIWAHHERAIPLPGFRSTTQVDDNAGALHAPPLTPVEHDHIETILGRTPADQPA